MPNRGQGQKNRQLTPAQLEGIQLMILWRFDATKTLKMIAETIGVSTTSIDNWRKNDRFRAEYERQLQIYKSNFEDLQLADRRERVVALQALYNALDIAKIETKLKILKMIREEVGDDHPVQLQVKHTGAVAHGHAHVHDTNRLGEQQGPNLPPRSQTYEEWQEQNRKAGAKKAEDAVVLSADQDSAGD